MKKLFAVLTLLLVMIFGIGAPQTAQAAFEEKPVGFVVIDKSGNLDMPTYKEWRTVTKWLIVFLITSLWKTACLKKLWAMF